MSKKIILYLLSILVISLSVLNAVVYSSDLATWKPLTADDLHDPANPSLHLLQNPGEALSVLPGDYVGNRVRWVKALEGGYIEPRTNFYESTQIRVLDLDIIMEYTGEMPLIRFPHKPHTEWLDCKNCHNKIFKMKVDANKINMFSVLQGEYCGRCHGAVAFPLTECLRCHSVDRNKFKGKFGAQYKDKAHKQEVNSMAKIVEILN